MATKKSPTKAKTNTRKVSKASTAARPARSARVSTKSVKAKPVAATGKVRSAGNRLLELHRLSAGVFILLAVLAGYFIKNTTYNLTFGYLTRDDLVSKTSTVLVPAAHGFYDINLRWIVVSIMALSAVVPLLWAFRWRRQYELNVEAGVMPQRWIDLAVTSALMVETIALLSGIHDIMTLKLIAGLMVLTCGLGWLADRENRQADKSRWGAYFLSLISGLLPWLLIAVTAITTYVYGFVRLPWHIYALYGATFVGFALMALNQRSHYNRKNQWKFNFIERNYILINLLVKSAFAIILIVGFRR